MATCLKTRLSSDGISIPNTKKRPTTPKKATDTFLKSKSCFAVKLVFFLTKRSFAFFIFSTNKTFKDLKMFFTFSIKTPLESLTEDLLDI